MFQRTLSILLPFAAILLVACQPTPDAFECTDPIGCVNIAPGESIKIAAFQALSGVLATDGQSNLLTIELALEDRGGELLGRPISLQSEDSLCSKEGGSTAASKTVADPQTVGILGIYQEHQVAAKIRLQG